jgi:hypothetical protein
MRLTLTGLKYVDSSIELAFQKKQQQDFKRAYQLASLIELLTLTLFLGVLSYYEKLSIGMIIFLAFGVFYVILAFFVGSRFKYLSHYLILVMEAWNINMIEELYKSTSNSEIHLSLGIIKISLTLICVSSTYNCVAKYITFIIGTFYLNEKLSGWGAHWTQEISWANYVFSTLLGAFFYFDEKQIRLTFGKFYLEIENLKRWKFISEKFIPAGNI